MTFEVAAAEREVALGALAASIDEHRPTPRELLDELEHGEHLPAVAALALVIPPQFVWSVDEGHVAEAAARDRAA